MSTDYKIIGTEILFDHSWAKIVVETIEHQGMQRPYFYVASPVEAVATVGLTSENEIILTQQYRHPVREVIYDLPAGRLEVGESPIDGARREFEEETGLEIKVGQYLFTHEFLQPPLHAIELFFEVSRIRGKLSRGFDPEMNAGEQIITAVSFLSFEDMKNIESDSLHYILRNLDNSYLFFKN